MGTRRKARELAMKALFCMDMLKNESDELLDRLDVRLKPLTGYPRILCVPGQGRHLQQTAD